MQGTKEEGGVRVTVLLMLPFTFCFFCIHPLEWQASTFTCLGGEFHSPPAPKVGFN